MASNEANAGTAIRMEWKAQAPPIYFASVTKYRFSRMTGQGTTKKIAIVQSNYIPWKGYFDLINGVDDFVFYDDMQYTRRDWRNRNMIKTPTGLQWLTIPVDVKGKYLQKIRETQVSDPGWAQQHLSSLAHNYARAPHFKSYRDAIADLYARAASEPLLSRINRMFVEWICGELGIGTRLHWSMDFPLVEGKSERLLGLCVALGATHYVSGPAARDYLDESLFESAGVKVEFIDYGGYPEYSQLHGPFEHGVTILDLLLNVGPDAPKYMKSMAVRRQ
jgi:hypothetical protein